MKKILLGLFLSICLVSNGYCVDEWSKADPQGSRGASDIDAYVAANNSALDRYLAYGRHDCKLSYASESTITVGAGSIVCSNSTGEVRRMRANTTATTVSWSDIDTGSENDSTTYYLWAIGDADTTTFTVKISLSSTAPGSSTYYKRLGSFYNDADSNITQIVDDEYSNISTYDSGWFAVSTSASYIKTHSLGTTKMVIAVFYSASSDGSSPMLVRNWDAESGYTYGYRIDTISTTNFTVKTAALGVNLITFPNTSATSGYYRVIALAFN